MTLEEAKEMFRKLFQGWIKELKDGRGSPERAKRVLE